MLEAPTLPPHDYMVPPVVLELRAAQIERSSLRCDITGRVFGKLYGLQVRFNVGADECQFLGLNGLWIPTNWWSPELIQIKGARTQ